MSQPTPILQPFSGAFHHDPYATYRRLREVDPVHGANLFGSRFWVLTRYADVTAALRDPRLSSQVVSGSLLPPALVAGNLLFADGAQHARLRQLVGRAFLPQTVEGLRDRVQALIDEQIDRALAIERQHGGFDALRDLAVPISLRTVLLILGLPIADLPRLRAWTEALSGLLDIARCLPGLAAAHRATAEVVAYFQAALHERRAQPMDTAGRPRDLLCALLQAQASTIGEPGAAALSDQEIFATTLFTLMAGHETVTSLIGSGLWLLAQHPAQRARLQDDHTLTESAVEEMLRCEPPAQLTTKTARCDLEIAGRRIEKDQLVVAVLAAANRDPAVFANPDCFDIARGDPRHLSFGHGPHFCVGAALARLQAQRLFATLLRRLPDLQIRAEQAVRPPGIVLRGLSALPLRSGL